MTLNINLRVSFDPLVVAIRDDESLRGDLNSLADSLKATTDALKTAIGNASLTVPKGATTHD